MFLNKRQYSKVIVSLIAILLSLTAFSANAHTKKRHHRHYRTYNDTVYVHEVYVFNPRPVVNERGKIIHNDIQFNPQPIINVPAQRCDK